MVYFKTHEGTLVKQWVGVEHLTSRTHEEEKQRREMASKVFNKLEIRKNTCRNTISSRKIQAKKQMAVHLHQRKKAVEHIGRHREFY